MHCYYPERTNLPLFFTAQRVYFNYPKDASYPYKNTIKFINIDKFDWIL